MKYLINRKNIFAFILGAIVFSTITYAAIISSSDVSYDNTNTNLTSTTVQGAIDELYEKSSTSLSTLTTYAVAYDACSGSGAPSQTTHAYGRTYNISNTQPTRSGYRFLGWSSSSCSGSVNYASGESFSNLTTTDSEIVTMYAIWKERPATCDYVCANGFTATYTNGTMTKCTYTDESRATLCNGGYYGSSDGLYFCKNSTSTYNYIVNYCSAYIDNGFIGGGGCPSTYECP